jgi:hypothetical protein
MIFFVDVGGFTAHINNNNFLTCRNKKLQLCLSVTKTKNILAVSAKMRHNIGKAIASKVDP